jgi:prevent-host-death family protein
MTRTTITQADLARKTQEVFDRARHGEVTVVKTAGEEQVVLLDALDFRLLQALAQCAIEENGREHEGEDQDSRVLRAYLSDEISLGKAAELLNLSRFELQERFYRIGVPLRLGPTTLEEARAEVTAARKLD